MLRQTADLDMLDRMMLVDQMTYLPDDLLAKVDRASMATSLEVRVPLLDHRVVEYSWSLPRTSKIRGGYGKWALREVLYRRVPRELIERPKVGFTVPLREWMRGPLRPWAEDLLSQAALRRTGVFNEGNVRASWSAFQNGESREALGIWAVLMFQAWSYRWVAS
jgi:asparagine synthase (glutamine-hydrolysing)